MDSIGANLVPAVRAHLASRLEIEQSLHHRGDRGLVPDGRRQRQLAEAEVHLGHGGEGSWEGH